MALIRIHDVVVTDSERSQVLEALDTRWISGSGPKVHEFETALGAFLRAPQKPIATTTGSAALTLALLAAGVKEGDHVLVSAYGFIATANAVRHRGAEPIFIGPEDGANPVVTVEQLRRFLKNEISADGKYKKTDRPLRGVLYNEPYGLACDELSELRNLFSDRSMFFIEDAAQAFGVEVEGGMLGTFGHFGAFSFNGNKTLSTGQGGALLGANPQAMALASRLSTQARSDDFDFFHEPLAYNFQLSNVLAGFGLGQLARIGETLENKIRIRREYREALRDTGWRLMTEGRDYPAWLNVVLCAKPQGREKFRELAARMEKRGMQVRPAFPAVPRNSYYAGFPLIDGDEIDFLFDRGLCLPSGPGLRADEIAGIAQSLREESHKIGIV